MNIREFTKPVTAKSLNESLAKRFGAKINVDKFTTEQLQDARNKLRTKLSQVETTESFDAVSTEEYTRDKMFLDVLNAAILERPDDIVNAIDEAVSTVTEGAEDAAELVMAAKDMVDRVTGWMEDTAEMQTESMLELADAIRDEMGSEQSEAFVNAVKPALESLYATMETTRDTLTQGVGMLTGEGEAPEAMGAEDPAMEPTVDGEMDMADAADAADEDPMADDGMEADAAAAGGEEEAGREKRESATPKGKRIKEGANKSAMMKDAEKMSKAEFIKKHGKENADTWSNMNESSKKKLK